MARTITVSCPNPQCGWFTNVAVEFDDGPSYLDARERAARIAAPHECGVATGEATPVTSAEEVVKTVDLGRATPAELRAFKKEQAAQNRELKEMRARG